VAAFGALAGGAGAAQVVAGLRAETTVSTALLLTAAGLAWFVRTDPAHAGGRHAAPARVNEPESR
ncbi:MFS transporter, partial [Paraburkholderia sp. CNPSo 3281]|nr:MFS transporter [Paraburkholderia sp. CNPSo 3281]